MNLYQVLVGVILPYVAIVAFIVGMGYRFRVWFTTKQPGKMKVYTSSQDTATRGVLKEVFLFRGLFNGDKVLWTMAWVFHVTLALVFLGHFRVITGVIDSILLSLGMSQEGVTSMSSTVGGLAGVVLLATAVALLVRRIGMQRVREISGLPDFLILVLIIAIITTGNVMRFGGEHFNLAETRAWAWGLLTFSPTVPANGMFLLHALLAQTLIILIPFSKLLHFGGIFFTQALVKRGI